MVLIRETAQLLKYTHPDRMLLPGCDVLVGVDQATNTLFPTLVQGENRLVQAQILERKVVLSVTDEVMERMGLLEVFRHPDLADTAHIRLTWGEVEDETGEPRAYAHVWIKYDRGRVVTESAIWRDVHKDEWGNIEERETLVGWDEMGITLPVFRRTDLQDLWEDKLEELQLSRTRRNEQMFEGMHTNVRVITETGNRLWWIQDHYTGREFSWMVPLDVTEWANQLQLMWYLPRQEFADTEAWRQRLLLLQPVI